MNWFAKCSGFVILTLAGICTSCDKVEDVKSTLENKQKGTKDYLLDNYQEVPGEPATLYLSETINLRERNIDALLEALEVGAQESAHNIAKQNGSSPGYTPTTLSAEAGNILTASSKVKSEFDSDEFVTIDPDTLSPGASEESSTNLTKPKFRLAAPSINWSSSVGDNFTISTLSKMPIRSQGTRGTCAAFTGVGQIEGYILKNFGVSSIDLSEQRFYYMSKPDHWNDGGDKNNEGSNSGTGFAKSAGYEHEGKTFPPDSPSNFNIPLETNCPYSKEVGDTDTQVPQQDGCLNSGYAKVKDFYAWLKDPNKRPFSAQDIYDQLVTTDVPVIVGSKLSENFVLTDGMITLAEAGTPDNSKHAGGHAYLVVGAKKLSESEFPNEGGMCFIIKNSWGRGWGVDGFACMTLAWWDAYGRTSGFPTVVDIDFDKSAYDLVLQGATDIPRNLEFPKDDSPSNDALIGSVPRGTVSFLTEEEDPRLANKKLALLIGDDDKAYKVIYESNGEAIYIQGILADGVTLTRSARLEIDGGSLVFNSDIKGKVEVGSIDESSQLMKLCTFEYATVCEFNFVEADNQLYIGLTKNEFLTKKSEGPYDWKGKDFAGYRIETSKPESIDLDIDVRIKKDDVYTNPLRFEISSDNGKILYQDQEIGSLANFTLCSGDYESVCRIIIHGETFSVLFK